MELVFQGQKRPLWDRDKNKLISHLPPGVVTKQAKSGDEREMEGRVIGYQRGEKCRFSNDHECRNKVLALRSRSGETGGELENCFFYHRSILFSKSSKKLLKMGSQNKHYFQAPIFPRKCVMRQHEHMQNEKDKHDQQFTVVVKMLISSLSPSYH